MGKREKYLRQFRSLGTCAVNSAKLLWADIQKRPGKDGEVAVFPKNEREELILGLVNKKEMSIGEVGAVYMLGMEIVMWAGQVLKENERELPKPFYQPEKET